MKVILIQNVKKQGKIGEIIEVSDGYAKNFLIAKGYAQPVNKQTLAQWQKDNKIKKEKIELTLKESELLKAKLDQITLPFKLKVNKGKVFGAITAKNIVDKLESEYNINIDKRKIIDYHALSQLITTTVKIKLPGDLIANLKIKIEEE